MSRRITISLKGTDETPDNDVTHALQEFFDEYGQAAPLGYSLDPKDHIWIGEDGELDPDDWIHEQLGPHHPLENILLPIIRAHFSLKEKKTINGNKQVEQQILLTRLHQALAALVGYEQRRGPKEYEYQALLEITARCWANFVATGKGKFSVVARGVIEEFCLLGGSKDADAENNKVKELGKKFGDRKEELLKAVTGRDTPEQQSRRNTERLILRCLSELGVPSEIQE